MVDQITVTVRDKWGNVLMVERYEYGFRFYFHSSTKSYFVKTDPTNPHALIITEEVNREAKRQYGDLYANLGVKNICGLFLKLLFQPEETVYGLIGKKHMIRRVSVRNYTNREGFEECVFSDLLTPQELLNA